MNIFFYLRQILIVLIILLTILQHHIFTRKIGIINFQALMILMGSVLNPKIRVHGNTDAFNNNNMLSVYINYFLFVI